MKEKELNQLKDILIKAKSVSDLYEVLPFLDEQGFSSEMFKERILDNYKEFSPEDFRILYNLSSRYDRFSWFIEGNREILNSTAEDILKEDLFDFSKKIKDIETLNSHKILTQKEQEKFERLKELYKEIYNKLVEEDTKKRQEKIHNSYLVLLKEILDFSKTAKSDEELIEFIQNKRILKSANDLRVLYRALKDCENEFTYDEMQDLLYNVLYTCEKYIDTKRNILKQFLIFDNAEDAVNYIFNYNKYSLFVDSYKNLNPKNFSEKELKKLEEIKLLSEKIISNLKSKERLIEIIEMTKSENYMFSKLVKYMFQIGLKPNLLEESIDEHKQDLSYEQTLILNNISNEYKRFLSYKSYYFKDVLDRKRNNYSDEFIANYLFDNNFSPSMFNRSLRELYPKISKEEYNILFEFLKYYTNIYDKLKERKKTIEKKEKYNKELKIAKKVVSEYILSKEKKDDKFDHYLKILKEIDDPLYAEYSLISKSNNSQRYAIIINNVKNMINLIENGIQLENGHIRKFDIIDYLSRTSLRTDEYLKIIKGKVSPHEYYLFKRFASSNMFIPINTNKLYNTFQSYNVQFDKSNHIIPGTGRIIEKYEKENIINYIKTHHLPFTENVYNALFDRWKKGYIEMPTKFNQDNSYLDSDDDFDKKRKID